MEIIDLCSSSPASPSINATQTLKADSCYEDDVQVIEPLPVASSSSSKLQHVSRNKQLFCLNDTSSHSNYVGSEPSTSRQNMDQLQYLQAPLSPHVPVSRMIWSENRNRSNFPLDNSDPIIVLSRSHSPETLSESATTGKGKQKEKCNAVPILVPDDQEISSEIERHSGTQGGHSVCRDPLDIILSHVHEVLPDAEPAHVRFLAQHQIHVHSDVSEATTSVLHQLLQDTNYPKLYRKGKKRQSEEVPDEGSRHGSQKLKKDFASRDRPFEGGIHYNNLAMDQLYRDFPFIPISHVRRVFLRSCNTLYAPTHLALAEEQRTGGPLPYKRKSVPTRIKNIDLKLHDDEFECEKRWLLEFLHSEKVKGDEELAKRMNQEEYEKESQGIECGCCFAMQPFDEMVQCPDAHLFCASCVTKYCETLLGSHNPNILCMDQSGCKCHFPESELQRLLAPQLMSLYDRVKQQKEIEAAGIEDLEECPFCEYKVVIDNPEEKLFRCENVDCMSVTCRSCKKADHLPKNCKEAMEDRALSGRHAVEEAMTAALTRNCPQCHKAFIKEQGCNKMTCPNCSTLSCYICRQRINGYDHFSSQPGNRHGAVKKCPLWDAPDVVQQRAEEVKEAAQKAIEKYRQNNPEVGDKDIYVDVPVPPTPKAHEKRMNPFYMANIDDHHHGHPVYRPVQQNQVRHLQPQGMQNPAIGAPGELRLLVQHQHDQLNRLNELQARLRAYQPRQA